MIMRARRLLSSMIDRIAYDEQTDILTVTFRENGKYLYYDVPAAVFDAFSKAPSAGSFFNAHVKDEFRCSRDPERTRFGPNA
jgi:hypothetical protein